MIGIENNNDDAFGQTTFEIESFLGTPESMVAEFEALNTSVSHQIKVAKTYLKFDRVKSVETVSKIVNELYKNSFKTRVLAIELKVVNEVLLFLENDLKDETLAKSWKLKAAELFPLVFKN